MLLWHARDFAIANLLIALVWLVLAIMVGREYRRRVARVSAPNASTDMLAAPVTPN
jgi:hypothetical protein